MLVPTGETSEVRIATIAGDTFLELLSGSVFEQLGEDGAAGVHPPLFRTRDSFLGGSEWPVEFQIVPASDPRSRLMIKGLRRFAKI